MSRMPHDLLDQLRKYWRQDKPRMKCMYWMFVRGHGWVWWW